MKKTYHIVTIGCQMNESDSERIAFYLELYGFKKESDRKRAGLVVVNTCSIRQSAENRNYGLIPGIKKENPKVKIILTGCLSERQDVKRRLEKSVDIWLPIRELPKLYKKLGIKNAKFKKADYLCLPPKTDSSFSVLIPIGNGCNNFCSYCVVPYARGREAYRSAGEIIKEAKSFIEKGYKEIILIAQNVNSYACRAQGKDLKYFPRKKESETIRFFELLERVAKIEGDFWVRFFTSHPKDLSDELIDAIATNKKICKQIHLPAQAGDNEILKKMNRKYTRRQYLKLVKKIKKTIPSSSVSTDVIVGFPGETKKQFLKTAELFEEVFFDQAYIVKYSPRPGTAAFLKKDNVSAEEKKRRVEELTKILRKTALANNKKLVGQEILVLVEKINKKGEWLGKNEQNKTVKILNIKNLKTNLIGKFVSVKLTEVKDFGLTGKTEN